MIPFLTYPLALAAAAALPALAAIYILRHRFRRKQVSSLMLWQFRVQSKEGGAKVHRLQLPFLFFLELLALILLVVAATGPHWKLAQSTRPLIVVLDDSFSMRAVSGKTSAQSRARDALQKLYRFQPPPSTRLILAGKEPQLIGSTARNWSEVNKLLEQWTCWSPDSAINAAITRASELGKQQANILVLTDHAPVEQKISNPRLQWRSFGVATPNVGFVNASRSVNGDEDRCLLEIANFSKASEVAGLLVRAGTNTAQQTQLSLAPGERQRVVLNIPASTPTLSAELTADALAEDNHVQLLPPIRHRVRVQLALTNSTMTDLIERTLDATGLRAKISDNPELIIHHSDVSPNNTAWSLNWAVPEKATAYTGPFIIDDSQPIAQGIGLAGAVWAAGSMTNSKTDVPVILAGNVPLVSTREDITGREFMTMNLDPELSTVTKTPDWPILFWNILQWRAREIPGLLDSNARLGTEVLLKTTGDPVSVRWPNGEEKTFARTGDQLSLETPLPGVYSVAMSGSTNSFAVNPLAGDESDLLAAVSGQWGNWEAGAENRYEQSPMAWLFALAALGLLTAHLWFLSAGKAEA
jgi:hypothetical protein